MMVANPWNVCRESDAPVRVADREASASHSPAWADGVVGEPRQVMAGSDSGVLALVIGVLVLIGMSMKHVRRIFKTVPQDLLSVRRRANVFDEHTANESRVAVLLLVLLFVCEGLLLYLWVGLQAEVATQDVARSVFAMSGLAASFYLFHLVACATVGYVFTDSVNAGLWRRGLNASQMLLAVLLVLPTLVALFYPEMTSFMLALAFMLYVLLRICYISKGVRIFYHKIPSLVYFILYLCTLEIIPVIVVCFLAKGICVKL